MKESGDLAILDEHVPYDDGTVGSLYEHLYQALFYSADNTGWHGLPKIGNADWNDCLNLAGPNGAAVSVMIAEMFVLAAKLMAGIAARSGGLSRRRISKSSAVR